METLPGSAHVPAPAPAPEPAAAPAPAKGVKKPFGGFTITFAGQAITMEKLFGAKPIPPSEMSKVLWAHVKKHKLSKKG